MNKKTLVELFSETGNFSGIDVGENDKGSLHSYLETYDKLFKPFRYGCTMLEIGLATGSSLKLWDAYFDNSNIVGCDISIVFQRPEYKNNVRIIQEDATKPILLEHLKEFMFDVCIDDSSHVTADQIETFNLLKDKMNKNGLYILEDILALDIEREKYLALHDNCEIIDMRHTGRFDNVLIIYRF